ncbi:MAG: sigma-54 dependent transcriptional regulator [Granulosicoccus sp.]|nr:sigma-54 dependent transcriptional regulator [Granulosicoccus sp.]
MINANTIFFVDDEEIQRIAVKQTLTLANYKIHCFNSANDMLAQLTDDWPGIIVSDLRMPDIDGLQLLEKVLEKDNQIPVILISGHADIADAVEAMQRGAYEFLEKNYSSGKLVDIVRRACDKRSLVLDNRHLRAELHQQHTSSLLIGRSAVMQELNKTLEYVASTDADVLIHGETGTGKELVAESIHQCSVRRSQRFVAINCGAMPENLFESEVFGHIRGAFTGADKTQMGKMEYANHGTLFLDEIESMTLNSQIKLLRALQERKIQRVGSNDAISLDLRVVAATKSDLLDASRQGDFREDLYYRLNVVTLQIPPLRERKEDIPLLFHHFYDKAKKRNNRDVKRPSVEFVNSLLQHEWPGNVRELQNFAERAAIGLPLEVPGGTEECSKSSLADKMDTYEKLTIERELLKQQGNINQTYAALGVSRKTLYDKMKKYGLSKNEINQQLVESE